MGKLVTMKQKADTVRGLLERMKPQMELALPKHLSPDRMLRIALNAAIRTPKLLDADPKSLLGAVMECATLGLEPDCLGQAYLIPFGKKVQVIIGYQGLLALARRSGQISTIQVGVVHKGDQFRYQRGLNPILDHIEAEGERGEITHFWAVATLRDGGAQFEVMSRAEIDAIRDGRTGAGRPSPWDTHYTEMGKKTALRRLCKLLPASIELSRAVVIDELAESDIAQPLPDVSGMLDVTPDADSQQPEPEPEPEPGKVEPELDEEEKF